MKIVGVSSLVFIYAYEMTLLCFQLHPLCLLLTFSLIVCLTSSRSTRRISPSPDWVAATLTRYKRQQAGEAAAAAAAAGEGDEEAPEEGAVVDLHNQEFCVDVSTFGPISFEAEPREKCDTTFEKRCETKSEQVRLSSVNGSFSKVRRSLRKFLKEL